MATCNCLAKIHVDDVGTKLRLTLKDQDDVVINISAATTKEITIKKPSGATVGPRAASFVTDGTDGEMEILSIAGDFDVAGPGYMAQGHVVIAAGDFHTEIIGFEVFANL